MLSSPAYISNFATIRATAATETPILSSLLSNKEITLGFPEFP